MVIYSDSLFIDYRPMSLPTGSFLLVYFTFFCLLPFVWNVHANNPM